MSTIPKDPFDRIALYVGLLRAEYTAEEIAGRWGLLSSDALFHTLRQDGFPVCVVCGEYSKSVTCSKHERERKARNIGGEAEELPSIANAATTFRDTIGTLEDFLEHITDLKETLQGRYFIGEGKTDEPNVREARGAQWHPHPYVVVLIAVSILERQGNWWHVERLLKELHPRPTEANRKQLFRHIYGVNLDAKDGPKNKGDGFLRRAQQIAALIRGAPEIVTGTKGPAIPSTEQLDAQYMRSLEQKGFSRERVLQTLRKEWERGKEEYLQSLREEWEDNKATLSQDEAEEYEHEIRRLSELQYDEDEFNRIWGLRNQLA